MLDKRVDILTVEHSNNQQQKILALKIEEKEGLEKKLKELEEWIEQSQLQKWLLNEQIQLEKISYEKVND